MEQKKLSNQNTKIKFKQSKHKILSERKHQNFNLVVIHFNKKIKILQKSISRTANLTLFYFFQSFIKNELSSNDFTQMILSILFFNLL